MTIPVFTKTATGDGTVYNGPVRVRQIFIHTATGGTPALSLYDAASATGGNASLTLSFGANETHNINIPDNGIRFTQQVFADVTNIKRVTFFLS
jgi:hypothetical protein